MEAENIKDRDSEKAEYWKVHIDRWKESGKRQIDYCSENNLSRHRFTYWKCKGNKNSDHKEVSKTRFIPVVTSPATIRPLHINTEPLKVQIEGRYRIEVGEGFCSETLTRLIKTLEDIR
jgi:hypothetical protein